jgi:Glycosyltransferase sugar-binding region containing DXD motif
VNDVAARDLPIIQYWHHEQVPADVADHISSFRDRNPGLRHLVFHEAAAEKFIAEHFTAREVAAFRACAVPSMQADYLRYCAVLALGGVYVDVSFRCLQSLQPLIEMAAGGVLFRQEPQQFIVNGIFAFKAPGHPLLQLALDVATANIEGRAAESVNMATGPWIFTGLTALHRLGSLGAARQAVAGQGIEPLVEIMLRVVGDFERVARALEEVRIAPLDMANGWVTRPPVPLEYKQSETRWVGWHKREGTIYR